MKETSLPTKTHAVQLAMFLRPLLVPMQVTIPIPEVLVP